MKSRGGGKRLHIRGTLFNVLTIGLTSGLDAFFESWGSESSCFFTPDEPAASMLNSLLTSYRKEKGNARTRVYGDKWDREAQGGKGNSGGPRALNSGKQLSALSVDPSNLSLILSPRSSPSRSFPVHD